MFLLMLRLGLEIIGVTQSSMIIFLHGQNTYKAGMQLQKMQEKFVQDRDPSGMNVVRVTPDMDDALVKEQILAAPFLAEKRMVVMPKLFGFKDGVLSWFEQEYDRLSQRDDVVLVVTAEIKKPKKAQKPLYEKLSAEKFAQQFDIPEGRAMQSWVAALAKEFGGQIDTQAATYLAQHSSDDMWRLASRVHQLVMYVDGGVVSKKDVEVFVDAKVEDAVFALMDAMTTGNTRRALQLLQAQLKFGSDSHQLFGMVIRQYRILTDLYSAQQDGLSESAMAKALKLHPFVVKKTLPLLKKYSYEQLQSAQARLLETDRKMKTGAATMDELLPQLVVSA